MPKRSTNAPRLADSWIRAQDQGLVFSLEKRAMMNGTRSKHFYHIKNSANSEASKTDHASLGSHQRDFVEQGHKGRLEPS